MRARAAWLFVVLAAAAAGCQDTTDSLGSNEASELHAITNRPATYQNPLRDVLNLSQDAINRKINSVYMQLFHGDADTQAIYVPVANTDQAYIYDVLHSQIRTEGQGLGMMIEVELEPGSKTNQSEFDSLWRYAKNQLQVSSGYFTSFCDSADQMTSTTCLDPYGLQQFVTALIFAHDRWGSGGAIDYQAEALALLHTMRFTVDGDGGVAGGVTNTFDATSNLPYSTPDFASMGQTRPSIVMPGYYAVWAQAAHQQMFADAAASGRVLWQAAANAMTGLTPIRSNFDGTPVMGWSVFDPESYRTQINMVIDQYWTGITTSSPICNQILAFFTGQGISSYGTSYTIDGMTCTNTFHEPSLVVANAIAAGGSSNSDRQQYLSALWNMQIPTGNGRYYAGILQLLGLMILGGQFQII
ncbi:MAG TPA: glycosyl hydrolase family 8 [Polyangia bacterium]|nr:glycosyl hydrolase family 8 [Polyangia bacterium]